MDATGAGRRTLSELLANHNKSAIARKLGVEPSTVWRWIRGETMPSADKLIELAELLGINAATIDLSSRAVA
jgi:transcriptional regulator with XRE-family HTH domain